MGTKVVTAASLTPTVFVYDGLAAALADDPVAHFCASHVIVIDGLEWEGLARAREGLIPEKRRFKGPFHPKDISPKAAEGVQMLAAEVDHLFAQLFPNHIRQDVTSSYRPMITGPEPMHFDTYKAPIPIAVSFVNLAKTARVYRVGPTFQELIARQPQEMRALGAKDISYRIRDLTMEDKPPMPKSGPAHEVAFAPGSIWFFNTKTASHEVVYGEGALGVSWTLPDIPALTQEQLLRTLQ